MSSSNGSDSQMVESIRVRCFSIHTSLENAAMTFGTDSTQYKSILALLATAEEVLRQAEDVLLSVEGEGFGVEGGGGGGGDEECDDYDDEEKEEEEDVEVDEAQGGGVQGVAGATKECVVEGGKAKGSKKNKKKKGRVEVNGDGEEGKKVRIEEVLRMIEELGLDGSVC